MDESGLASFLLLSQHAPGAEHGPPLPLPLSFLIVAVLLLVNGFFVALEFALVGLRRTRVDEMVREGMRGSAAVKRGKDHVDDFVAAAQLGITVASLALGMVAEETVIAVIGPPLREYFNVVVTAQSGVGFVISIALVTVLHVVIGEQVPKMLAIQRPARTALLTAPIAEWFLTLCKPFIRLLSWLTELILHAFGLRVADEHHSGHVYSEEEIRSLLASRHEAGLVEAEENEMIARVFTFFDMVATQIMIPRTEMVCVSRDASLKGVMEVASEEGHDRYPVFGENFDEIVGIVLIKDIVAALNEGPEAVDYPVVNFIRPALCVPGSLAMSSLMTQMREQHTRLAIVLDEYGGTAGMVTLGDVLERIVGEVDEENEEEEPEDIVRLPDGRYSISGLLLTEDIEEFFDYSIEDEHNDTIAGVVFSELGRKPEIGDEVRVNGLVFEVEQLDGHRIDRLLVRHEPVAESTQEASEEAAS